MTDHTKSRAKRRAQRRAEQDRARWRRRERAATPVEDYRAPPGQIAMTFDFEGSDPSTIEIEAGSLVDTVTEIGKHVSGWSYQRALQMLGGIHRAWKQGRPGTENGMLLGFWAALHHPASGDAMRRKIAERMASGARVHITMFAGRDGGIAFTMGDSFVDLAELSRLSRAAGVGIVTAEVPDRARESVQ